MKHFFFFATLLFLLIFSACSFNRPVKLKWAFVEVEKITFDDTTNYYYYGQLNQKLVTLIDKNTNPKGFFTLRNIRYIDTQNLLEVYADSIYSGTLVFRIQDIIRLEILQNDPIFIFKNDALTPRALEIKNTQAD